MKRDCYSFVLLLLCFLPLVLTKAFVNINVAIPLVIGTFYLCYFISKKYKTAEVNLLWSIIIAGLSFCSISLLHNGILTILYRDFFPCLIMGAAVILLGRIKQFNCWNDFEQVWKFLLKIVVVSSFISGLFFKLGLINLAVIQDVENYACAHYPFLGLINLSSERVAWYFAEPSYLGFFLGFNLIFAYNFFKNKGKGKIWLILYVLSILFVGSSTGIFASIGALAFYLLYRNGILKSNVWKLLFLALIPFLILYITTSPDLDVLLEYFGKMREQNSGLDRSKRLIYAVDTISRMNSVDLMIGMGENYFLDSFGVGVANTYIRIVIEYGCIYLLTFILLTLTFLKHSTYEYFFFFIAINSTDIAMTPLSLFLIVMAYYYNKYKPNYV